MSQNTPTIPSMSDLSHREGLMIVAAVSLLMIVLVILRFGCNVCIDVCVLRDLTAARNTMRDFWNFVCPCCRLQLQEQDEEEQMRGESEIELSDVNSLLLRLTTQEKSLLISSILTSKVVTAEDLASWNDTGSKTVDCEAPENSDKDETQDTSSEASMECSICLHNFQVGDHVSETSVCSHLFHGDCLKQWLDSNNRAACCPYCRADIITAADVKRTLHRPVRSNEL
eukprot:CAMPEP_0202487020 /NCGR_PEP_ID=MMETSP1361-20130828/5458_1 /ASSEMBLY_ACC=CAM_ASM_000849 /TAXON_ID=210615 /ORGANISM="Staurosira complex sp., Strain CCMP2646" /LENGTH=226 /DNA_ID=CAMNT_0049116317 /DNA_START=116 /DNA_END=796 /DNA_ORIENTATION=-